MLPEVRVCVIPDCVEAGIVGQIGTILGDNSINIAAMNFGRTSPGGESIIVLNVDSEVSDEVLEKIRKSDNILDAKRIRL